MSERLLIALLTAIQFTFMVDFVLMMPLGPQLQRELHCDAQAFSFLVASYIIAGGVAALGAAAVIDRFERKRLLLVVYAGMSLATILCGLCDHYATLLCARIAAGACGGLIGTLVMTIIGARIPYERRGMATGAVMSSLSIASVLGIPIGLWLAQGTHWTLPFLVIGGVGLAVLACAARILEPMREHLGEPRRKALAMLRQVFGNVQHRQAFAVSMCLTFAGFSVIPLLATYVVRNTGLAEGNLSWLYGIGGVFTTFTGPYIGRLADRYGKHLLFATVAALSTIPIAVVTNLPPVPQLACLAICVVFMILVSGRFVPAMAIITQAADPAVRGGFQACNTAVQNMSMGAASVIGGLVVQQEADGRLTGYQHAGWIAVAATLISIALAQRLRPIAGGQAAPLSAAAHAQPMPPAESG